MFDRSLFRFGAALVVVALLATAAQAQFAGDVFALGLDDTHASHLWRFSLDGTYVDDIAPGNSYQAIVLPGDGFLYGIDAFTGDFARMNFDGTGATNIDAIPNPTDIMGHIVHKGHADGEGGILITPHGNGTQPRTLVRYSNEGKLLAQYTGMEHSSGIAGDYDAGLVFSAGSSVWDVGLYSFPWAGGSRTTLAPSTGAQYDMAIDREKDILFLSDDSTSIEKRDYSGNLVGTVDIGLPENYAIEYDGLTGYLFSASVPFFTGPATVRCVDMNGNVVQDYQIPSMHFVRSLAVHTVPEPSTVVLLCMGAVGLLTFRRRRR